MNDSTKRWLLDAGERAGRTFLQAALALWLAVGADFDHLFSRDVFEAGVVGLALSLAMSVGAKRTGADDSASLLPADVDPPQDDGRADVVTVLLVIFLVIAILAIL